jgi:hypothetical protein
MTVSRTPYVGSGEDGCRRSAQADREEADRLGWGDPRKEELDRSAERWEEQGYQLMLERIGPRPTLAQLREQVGSEQWLAALALLELSPAVATDAAQFTSWSRDGGRYTYAGEGEDRVGTFHPQPEMDWLAWVADVAARGRGWSSTESRLYQLVAALVGEQPLQLAGVLDNMGSWEREVLDVLVQWASGGNNRELPGRLRVQAQ